MTILIYGITGDLAKTKILPALGEFKNKDLKVIGYSRSVADKPKLENLLGAEILLKIGSYDDLGLVKELWDQELIIYLATPPSTNFDFLRQISKEKSNTKLQILVEKPFGKNLEEAKEMLDLLKKTNWRNSVKFLDHYKFKAPDFENLPKQLKSISISALETNIVGARGGYYDTVGAIDDMLIHLYSLLKMVIQKPINSWQNISLKTSQYDTYRQEVGNLNSTTETYFEINCEADKIRINLESGKKQAQKSTKIDINNGDYVLEFAPEKRLFCNDIWQNLEDNKSDHCRIFEAMQNKNYDQFVSDADILEYFGFLGQLKK